MEETAIFKINQLKSQSKINRVKRILNNLNANYISFNNVRYLFKMKNNLFNQLQDKLSKYSLKDLSPLSFIEQDKYFKEYQTKEKIIDKFINIFSQNYESIITNFITDLVNLIELSKGKAEIKKPHDPYKLLKPRTCEAFDTLAGVLILIKKKKINSAYLKSYYVLDNLMKALKADYHLDENNTSNHYVTRN